MTAIFEMNLGSETLRQDELTEITGCSRRVDRIAWLQNAGWIFFTNKAGEAVVGRLYARLKLAGINPSNMAVAGGWTPNINNVR